MNKLKNIAAEWWPDGLMSVGAGAVSFGVWQMHAPSGWIVGGVFVIVAGVLGSRR